MLNEFKLRNKWLAALLLASMVMALGACSSSDEASEPAPSSSEEVSGESGDGGTNCDMDNAAMQVECERQEAMRQ